MCFKWEKEINDQIRLLKLVPSIIFKSCNNEQVLENIECIFGMWPMQKTRKIARSSVNKTLELLTHASLIVVVLVLVLLLRGAQTLASISIIQQFQLCNLLVIPTDIVLVKFWHIIGSVCFLMTNSRLFCNPPNF